MLRLHPKLIAICKASYDKDGVLLLSDDVLSFDKDSVLSVRYLNRIEADSCAKDGLISCRTRGPDKLLPHQVPPIVLMKAKKLEDERHLPPLVYVDSLTVGLKKRKRWHTLGADGVPLRKMVRLPAIHPVINFAKVPRLSEGHYLFPFVDPPGEDGRRLFAMVPQGDFDDVFDKFLPSCSVSFYHDTLGNFETVSLRCLDVGDQGVSGTCDPNKGDGVQEEYSHPFERTGLTFMTWLPVTNGRREPLESELDSIVNVDAILELARSTHGRSQNAPRKVADSSGLNIYLGRFSKVSARVCISSTQRELLS